MNKPLKPLPFEHFLILIGFLIIGAAILIIQLRNPFKIMKNTRIQKILQKIRQFKNYLVFLVILFLISGFRFGWTYPDQVMLFPAPSLVVASSYGITITGLYLMYKSPTSKRPRFILVIGSLSLLLGYALLETLWKLGVQ